MISAIRNIIPMVPKNYVSAPKNSHVSFKMNLNNSCDSVCFSLRVEDSKPEIMAKTPSIIMLGAPASGKGTMTEFIKRDLNLPHVDMGGMLRSAIKEESELGKKAVTYMSEGKLVPDEVVIGIVRDRLAKDDCKKGFILDGFPRTIEQAKALDGILKELGQDVKVVNIDLDISRQDFLDRIVNRRLCSDKACGAVYNLKSKPPLEEGVCDKCNAPLEHRKDDTEEVALKRLATYEEQTKPLIEYYQAQGRLISVKASTGSKENYDSIKESISTIYQELPVE